MEDLQCQEEKWICIKMNMIGKSMEMILVIYEDKEDKIRISFVPHNRK